MSKYNLTELLSEVKGGRIGTLNITAMDLERKMEELEDEGITINRFYDSPDGKTYVEYHVHPEYQYNPDESFSVYDFKFGEDPTDIDNEDKEYPFSIGGRGSALSSAKALLGSGQVAYSIDEGEAIDLAIEASQKKAGIKEGGDKKRMNEGVVKSIMQALRDDAKATDAEIKQYMTSLMKAGDEFDDIDDYVEDFKEYISSKSLDETGNTHIKEKKKVDFIRALKIDANGTSIEIKSYLESLKQSGDKFDSVDDYVEDFKNYVADKSLQEHFGRFLKDYQ